MPVVIHDLTPGPSPTGGGVPICQLTDHESYTQGESLDELWANIQEAVAVHYEYQPVTLQLVIESHVPPAASTAR